MDIFLQQIINGLVLGSMYALVALGYTMVYGIVNLINFAHGEVLMVGALTSWTVCVALANAGLPGWLDSGPTLTEQQIRLIDIQLVGNYALAPSWGDGHHTGYYTFDLLRHHCRCAECSAERAAFKSLVDADPKDSRSLYYLAEALTDLEQFDESDKIYRQLLEKTPDDTDLLASFGLSQIGQKKLDEAAKTFEMLLKQQDVYNYDRTQFESKRIWVPARDGVKVPVALVYRKGTPMDGTAPMLLYAYGSYGASIDPTFSTTRLSLLDRGFIYALAGIRGGGELGEPWREGGRMMKKMNTFTDFIDVAAYLEKNKYTSADRMMIQGGSAGGLLMGAVVNVKSSEVVGPTPFVLVTA